MTCPKGRAQPLICGRCMYASFALKSLVYSSYYRSPKLLRSPLRRHDWYQEPKPLRLLGVFVPSYLDFGPSLSLGCTLYSGSTRTDNPRGQRSRARPLPNSRRLHASYPQGSQRRQLQ